MNRPSAKPLDVLLKEQIERYLPEGAPKRRAMRWILPRAIKAQRRQAIRADKRSNPARAAMEKLRSAKKGARARADAAFSEYIRTRDTVLLPDGIRYGNCRTCGRNKRFSELQCGHWIPRGQWGTRYHQKNANAQCAHCNDKRFGAGRPTQHEAYIAEKHGPGVPDFLREWAKLHPRKPITAEFKAIAEEFEEKTAAILERERPA